jgi:hypothetical protein
MRCYNYLAEAIDLISRKCLSKSYCIVVFRKGEKCERERETPTRKKKRSATKQGTRNTKRISLPQNTICQPATYHTYQFHQVGSIGNTALTIEYDSILIFAFEIVMGSKGPIQAERTSSPSVALVDHSKIVDVSDFQMGCLATLPMIGLVVQALLKVSRPFQPS